MFRGHNRWRGCGVISGTQKMTLSLSGNFQPGVSSLRLRRSSACYHAASMADRGPGLCPPPLASGTTLDPGALIARITICLGAGIKIASSSSKSSHSFLTSKSLAQSGPCSTSQTVPLKVLRIFSVFTCRQNSISFSLSFLSSSLSPCTFRLTDLLMIYS